MVSSSWQQSSKLPPDSSSTTLAIWSNMTVLLSSLGIEAWVVYPANQDLSCSASTELACPLLSLFLSIAYI